MNPTPKTVSHPLSTFYPSILLLFLFHLSVNAQVISKDPRDLLTVGSESIVFQSEINKSEYKLYINLPDSYDSDPTKTYPVYYALDGYRIFDTTTRIYKGMWNDGFAPETIIVGIDYSASKDRPSLHRTKNLTPTTMEGRPTSGGAPLFLQVLHDEIIPMIDRLYRSDKVNRTLMGTSFAALFAQYVLFTQPSLCSNYIINNPTLWWDNEYPYQLEEAFYQKNKNLNTKVIFLSGEFDDVARVTKMVEQIKGHDYSGMTLGFRVVENMGHLGGEAEAINQGMRYVYKRPTVILPEAELRAYCGTYRDREYTFEIAIKDGELNLIHKWAPQGVKIQAINKTEFAVLGRYFDFHFNKNEEGDVIGFYTQGGTDSSRSRTAIKIN